MIEFETIILLVVGPVQICILVDILLVLPKELVEVIVWFILLLGQSLFEILLVAHQAVTLRWLLNGASETWHVFNGCIILILVAGTSRLLRWHHLFLHLLCKTRTFGLILLLLRSLSFLFFDRLLVWRLLYRRWILSL